MTSLMNVFKRYPLSIDVHEKIHLKNEQQTFKSRSSGPAQ